MPRLPRISLAGITQHIVQRGNNRQVCFFCDTDYSVYLDKLREYSNQFAVQVHAYVLMTNHVHLLVTPQETWGVSKMMQVVGRYYVMYVNRTYHRTGTLWDGRFKVSLVDSERYVLQVYRYIEQNPVRASMVDHPASYPWSGYQANALGKRIKLLSPHPIYLKLGMSPNDRQAAYRELHNEILPEKSLSEIRHATEQTWILGDERFKAQVEQQLQRKAFPSAHGGDRKSPNCKAKNQVF